MSENSSWVLVDDGTGRNVMYMNTATGKVVNHSDKHIMYNRVV